MGDRHPAMIFFSSAFISERTGREQELVHLREALLQRERSLSPSAPPMEGRNCGYSRKLMRTPNVKNSCSTLFAISRRVVLPPELNSTSRYWPRLNWMNGPT